MRAAIDPNEPTVIFVTYDDREPSATDYDIAFCVAVAVGPVDLMIGAMKDIVHCINNNPGYFRRPK